MFLLRMFGGTIARGERQRRNQTDHQQPRERFKHRVFHMSEESALPLKRQARFSATPPASPVSPVRFYRPAEDPPEGWIFRLGKWTFPAQKTRRSRGSEPDLGVRGLDEHLAMAGIRLESAGRKDNHPQRSKRNIRDTHFARPSGPWWYSKAADYGSDLNGRRLLHFSMRNKSVIVSRYAEQVVLL